MKKEIRAWLTHAALFYLLIVCWECLVQLLSFGALRGWFLLFALPEAAIPASLCLWKKDWITRIAAALLALALGVFYAAHLIYFRIFGSMISLSMLGVGGDAMENFGWALAVTLRESVPQLLLLALPLLALGLLYAMKKPRPGGLSLPVRAGALLFAALLWPLCGLALRLGGTSDASAHHAFRSAYVDTDTAAQKLGVLTTSTLEAGSMLFGSGEEDEMADAFSDFAAAEQPLPAAPTPEPTETPESEPEAEAEAAEEPRREPIDFAALAEKTDDAAIRSLCEYCAALPTAQPNEYTGLLKDYNVVVICAESFASVSISEELTPTLWRMAHEGVVLTNYYNSFKNTTTNGEFALLTGLWPDLSRKADVGSTRGSFSQSATHFMPYGLGNILAGEGVKSYMFHNYIGSYYGRDKSHANLGYTCRFSDTMKLSYTWPASDLEMMQQTVDDYINDERFNVYYMTFSGHGPYNITDNPIVHRNFSHVPEVVDGHKLNVLARCFFASALELEWSAEYLLERLEEAGKLDNTLVVIAGDHYPYYLNDGAAYSILGGQRERMFERCRSTCIMWCGGLDEPIVCDAPCCNVDVLPTVLNLLGVDYDPRLLSGRDVFSDAPHVGVLWNKSFVTDALKYNAESGESSRPAEGVFADSAEQWAYINAMNSSIKASYAAALAINKTDFYRFVWENAGLSNPPLPAAAG